MIVFFCCCNNGNLITEFLSFSLLLFFMVSKDTGFYLVLALVFHNLRLLYMFVLRLLMWK